MNVMEANDCDKDLKIIQTLLYMAVSSNYQLSTFYLFAELPLAG